MKTCFLKISTLALSISVLSTSLIPFIPEKKTYIEESRNAIIVERLRPAPKIEVKVISVKNVEEPEEEIQEDISLYDNLELLARVTFAEAGNQSELGKRLVIDTILNRVDSKANDFKNCNTVKDVCYQTGQFTTVSNGAIWKYPLDEDILDLIDQEIANRTNYEVLWFRTGYYHSFGRSLFPEGAHWFSGL